jgi:hypothetical protein
MRYLIGLARLLVVALGTAGAIGLLAATDATAAAWVVGGLLLIAAGALADRAWACGLPVLATAVYVAVVTVAFYGGDAAEIEIPWWFIAAAMLAFAVGVSLLLLLGVGIRRMVAQRDLPRQRSAFSPQNDAAKLPL